MGFDKHGSAEVIRLVELDDPKPMAGEVVIRLLSTSVNRLDTLVREGIHGLNLKMPHVPGTDIVGIIEKPGANADMFQEGEVVIGNTVYGCGTCDRCLAGQEQLCPQWKCIGLHVNGTYGELISVPERILSRPPAPYTPEELAAMPLDLSVAWRSLRALAQARSGETVLVRGASGNVGIFCIMLAKAMELKTIALTRSTEKMQKLKDLGADEVLDYTPSLDAVRKAVMSTTDDKGADIIIETFGSTLNESVELAAYSGRIITFGTILGGESKINVRRLYLRNINIFGMHNASKAEFDAAFEFASDKNIRPIIAKTFGVEDASEAQRVLEGSKLFGKIILKHW